MLFCILAKKNGRTGNHKKDVGVLSYWTWYKFHLNILWMVNLSLGNTDTPTRNLVQTSTANNNRALNRIVVLDEDDADQEMLNKLDRMGKLLGIYVFIDWLNDPRDHFALVSMRNPSKSKRNAEGSNISVSTGRMSSRLNRGPTSKSSELSSKRNISTSRLHPLSNNASSLPSDDKEFTSTQERNHDTEENENGDDVQLPPASNCGNYLGSDGGRRTNQIANGRAISPPNISARLSSNSNNLMSISTGTSSRDVCGMKSLKGLVGLQNLGNTWFDKFHIDKCPFRSNSFAQLHE